MSAYLKNHGLVTVAAAIAVALVICAIAYANMPTGKEAQIELPPVRSELSEYTWEELSRIAAGISRCPSREEATAFAARFRLCDSGGKLNASRTKKVELAHDGSSGTRAPDDDTADCSEAEVALIGIWHDTRTDGGKAGLTFAFVSPIAMHAMNHSFEDAEGENPDSVGGWAASEMRAWLNCDFLYELPIDLRSRIVSVQKPAANAVGSLDELEAAGSLSGTVADWVSLTDDVLWLLSVSELCGSIPAKDSLGVDSTMAAAYAAEGEQYQLFADEGVEAFRPNEIVAFTLPAGGACTWWLRTKTLEFGDGFWLVGTDGTPLNGLGEDVRVLSPEFAPDELWGPDHARAVVPCFCL